MTLKIKLKDIVDEIDYLPESFQALLNRETGEIATVSEEHFRAAEESDDLSHYAEWEQELIEQAGAVLASDDYLALPSEFDIHEYQIIDDFCRTLVDEDLRDKMQDCIKGKGAFGRFRNNIIRYGIEQNWFDHRRQALRDIAARWCRENDIPYVE